MATKQDPRTRRSDASRASRAATADASRQGESLLSTVDARALIRSEFVQEALPKIQAPPGWHYCWLSITSQHDPVHKRMRLGYTPVSFEELVDANQGAGYEGYKATTGEFAGAVTCNEMVLFKVTLERYQLIMAEFHHHMPLEEELGIKNRVEDQASTDRTGRKLVDFDDEDDGMQKLGESPAREPTFV